MRHLNVVRKGKGKPILLLHGLLSDHRQLYPLLPALDGYECFFVDLIGCGKSDKKPSLDILAENTEFIRALCEKHNIDTVIAYSIGGLIAIELNLQHTIFIASFCKNPLTAGTLKNLQGKETKIKELLIRNEKLARAFIRKYLKNMKGVPGMEDASTECAIQYLLAGMRNYDEAAERLRHVLVMHGTKDVLVHHSLGMHLAHVCQAGYIAVPEDHLSILQNDIVLEAAQRFLSKC